MKLRVRSLESRETLKIEVPNPCSILDFNRLLSLAISSHSSASSSSSSSSSSIFLSLNRKDELQASSSLDSLQSLGVTSGDLIFYSFNPAAFARYTHVPIISETLSIGGTSVPSQTPPPNWGHEGALVPSQALGSRSAETLIESQIPGEAQTLAMTKRVMEESPVQPEKDAMVESQALAPSAQTGPPELEGSEFMVQDSKENGTLGVLGATGMDVDGVLAADGDEPILAKSSFSEPCFLRKVLREEVGDEGNENKLLVIAVHAVMLDSGFVGFDLVSGMRVDRFHLLEERPSAVVSIWYTLPELLDHVCDDSPAAQSVVLKFQRMGQFINTYGSLTTKRSTVHHVILDEYRFAPTLDLMWTHSDPAEEKTRGSSDSYPENEVFEFWKIVKDGLALPLLIDLCEKGGLPSPPCLMRLPTEVKLKILELLPAIDVLKVGSVCSELLYLSSNNDLWKLKFIEEFGDVGEGPGSSFWKNKFRMWWDYRKKRKRENVVPPYFERQPYFRIRDPNPFGIPTIFGGDYDLFPSVISSPFGRSGRRYPQFLAQRNAIPRCNFGGFIG